MSVSEQFVPGQSSTSKFPPSKALPPYEIGYHHTDYLKDYKGCYIAYPNYLTLDDVGKFEASPLDVAICSFPKSGTTWLSGIVMGIQGGGVREVFHDAPLMQKSPFFCRSEPELEIGKRPIDILKNRPPGRMFFTHLAYQALPESMIRQGCKKVYTYRNPKDCAISLFHMLEMSPRIRFQADLEEVVDTFLSGKVENGPYFDHLASFWSRRHSDPNLFICSFEELKKNANGVITRLAKFLGKELTTEQIALIQAETAFENFQANPMLNKIAQHENGFFDFNKHQFIRDGSVGQWKTWFTPSMNKKMDDWIALNLARPELQGLAFEFE